MSEANLEVHVEFSSLDQRDKAIEFLNDEGPTFEDEVEDAFRPLFILQEEVDPPEELEPVGDNGLYAFFEVFGADGFFRAQEYLERFSQAGATKTYGFFKDDEETELCWTVKDERLVTIYSANEDEELDEILWDLEGEDRLKKLIELHESGPLN